MTTLSLSEYVRRHLRRVYTTSINRLRQRTWQLRISPQPCHAIPTGTASRVGRQAPSHWLTRLPRFNIARTLQLFKPAPFQPAVTLISLSEPTFPEICLRNIRRLLARFNAIQSPIWRTLTAHASTLPRHTDQASTATLQNYAYISPRYRPPRHPIVLCHGLFGFDKIGPNALPSLQIHYWRGIQEALRRMGAEVYVARVSRADTIAQRASQLDQALWRTLAGRKINLIAHSMGGLDGRYLITHLRPRTYRICSLTTISTPHRGSPFMDWCRDHLGLAANEPLQMRMAAALLASTAPARRPEFFHLSDMTSRAKETNAVASPELSVALAPRLAAVAHHLSPILRRLRPLLDYPAYANLTTTYLRCHFNPTTPDSPEVRYFSYGARASTPSLTHILRVPWEVVSEKEGINDGLVSVESARWGQYLGTVEADHWELNNRMRFLSPRRPNFDVIEFYLSAAHQLYLQGL
jgi:pimeloyl-ACP methyl ester carboxylesterase